MFLVPLSFNYFERYMKGYTKGRYRERQGEIARNKKARTRRAS